MRMAYSSSDQRQANGLADSVSQFINKYLSIIRSTLTFHKSYPSYPVSHKFVILLASESLEKYLSVRILHFLTSTWL